MHNQIEQIGKNISGLKAVLQLLVPLSHEKQRYCKGISFGFFIKIGEKWIVSKLLKYQIAVEFFLDLLAKRCFSGTYITFDANVMIGKIGHKKSYSF